MIVTPDFWYFFIVVVILIIIACYAALAIFLNKFNKKVYGTSTVMSWIPFANVYLLGKLTFSKDAGYGLIALFLLSGTLKLTFDRTTIVLSLPNVLQVILGAVFAGAFIATLIFAINKYDKISTNNSNDNKNKEKKTKNEKKDEIANANDEFFNN